MVGTKRRRRAPGGKFGRRPGMGCDPPAFSERVVDAPANDGMAEPEPARDVSGTDQPGLQQLVEGRQNLRLLDVKTAGGGGDLDLAGVPGHRCPPEEGAGRPGELSKLLGEGAPHGHGDGAFLQAPAP